VAATHPTAARSRPRSTGSRPSTPSYETAEGEDFTVNLNEQSLDVLTDCKLEPSLANAMPGQRYQFERLGYFCVDSKDSVEGKPVFNRTVTLKDEWAKLQKKSGK
jgi:glutaminyl-tRNA synthetase